MKIRQIPDSIERSRDFTRLFLGPSGIGKTTITRDFLIENGYHVIILYMNVLQREDFIGIPKVVEQDNRLNLPGYYINVPNKYIFEAMQQNDKIAIVLDELTRLPPPEQGFLIPLLDKNRLGDIELPRSTIKVCLGNPSSYSGTYEIIEALKDRLLTTEVEADSDSWLYWCVQNNIDERIMAFISYDTSLLFQEGETSPRGWTKLSERIKGLNVNDSLFIEEVHSEVGEEIGAKFLIFIRNLDSFPPIRKVIEGKEPFPSNLEVQYIVSIRIANFLLENPEYLPHFLVQSLEWPREIVNGAINPILKLDKVILGAPNVSNYQEEFREWCRVYRRRDL